MKPDVSLIPAPDRTVEARKPLTAKQRAELALAQKGICGCGCGEPLDPVTERVVDEHVIPRKLVEEGSEAERDVIENRRFYRWPCALKKTKADLAQIAKADRQGGETGQYARRQKRGEGTIKTRPGGWPKGRKLPTKKAMKAKDATASTHFSTYKNGGQ